LIASRGSSQTAVYISALNFAGSPDDVLRLGRRILECAVAADADAIVTGDRHLLRLRRFRGTSIMSPRDFLDREIRQR